MPEEAEIIPRIFCEVASGKSPNVIVVDLNREGVNGSLVRAWGDTSIRGHGSRGTCFINNELYTGVLAWSYLRYIEEPPAGRRVSGINRKAGESVQSVNQHPNGTPYRRPKSTPPLSCNG
ncbi:recombinase family protein [Brucellaceae bacterium D45D]